VQKCRKPFGNRAFATVNKCLICGENGLLVSYLVHYDHFFLGYSEINAYLCIGMRKVEYNIVRKLVVVSVLLLVFVCSSSAQQTGKATYYSHRLHGVKMSDGSKYHRDSMTCAHKTYPLGSTLKVTNLVNNKEVIVKVTDRGPYGHKRIIDLSYAAAKELDIIRSGVASVQVEKIEPWIPFNSEKSSGVPMLKLTDPNTGEYVTLAEAKKTIDRELAKKSQQIALSKLPKTAKPEPRYRILRNVLSAKSN
jgi:rare lipoprotein A